MANPEHLAVLKKGVQAWNAWREEVGYTVMPDLSGADLRGMEFGRQFDRPNLRFVDCSGTDFRDALMVGAVFERSILVNADFRDAGLHAATFRAAELTGADFSGSVLTACNFREALLRGAKFDRARFAAAAFADNDLRSVGGLETVVHDGPSTIGIDTFYRSQGEIPESFMRGCGVPEQFIVYARSLAGKPIEYYSCFISYSTKDQAFAERLAADLQAKGVRCWFAPHDIQGGRKIHEQIDQAIRVYDRLLLILTQHSMGSDWVNTEISKARKRERDENRQMLFPIRLVPFEALQNWNSPYAEHICEYFIPDFSAWKTDHDAYQAALARLLRDLRGAA